MLLLEKAMGGQPMLMFMILTSCSFFSKHQIIMKLKSDLLTKSIDEALLCPVCSEPYSSAVITKCGHSFCRACVEDDSLCVYCKEAIGNGELRKNYAIRCLVDNLLVKCPNHKNGCAWIGSAKEAPWHEELCSKKNEEGAVVPEDELPYYDDSILAPGKDVNDHLSIGPTLSSKPEVTCGGGVQSF